MRRMLGAIAVVMVSACAGTEEAPVQDAQPPAMQSTDTTMADTTMADSASDTTGM